MDSKIICVTQTNFLQGCVIPPSSKSQSIRALFFALLVQGESILSNVLDATDVTDAMLVCKSLGAKITRDNGRVYLASSGLPLDFSNLNNKIYTGNSGITTHFILPILGLQRHGVSELIVDCGPQMQARPIGPLLTALVNLGLEIKFIGNQQALPIIISGQLVGGETYVSGITSQYLSALLVALPCSQQNSTVIVENLKERPYVDMTLQWLDRQGIIYRHTQHHNIDEYYIQGQQSYTTSKITIAADFSSAAYLIASAVLVKSEVEIQGLDFSEPQADKELIAILQAMGAEIMVRTTSIYIKGGLPLQGMQINMDNIPDLLPILAVVGTYAHGVTELYNAQHARLKETDRLHSMTQGLSKLGAEITETTDSLIIYNSCLKGAKVAGYADHRTVMALCVAGLLAKGVTKVSDYQAVTKSFPNFIHSMQKIGANIALQ